MMLSKLVTLTIEFIGNVRCAAVSWFMSKISPFALRRL